MSSFSTEDMQAVRARFPALVAADSADSRASGYIYAENAGGSQVLSSVASSISSYLLSTNVQMAAYPLAATAASQVSLGNAAAAILLGASSPDEVMIGQSATSLVFSLSLMIEAKVLADRKEGKAEAWKEGDEMIVSDADHETNRGAWVRLAERLGLKVKHWPVTPIPGEGEKNKYAVTLDPSVLSTLVTPKTRIVAFTACSNLLGAFTDIPASSAAIRSVAPKAIVAVDCVAFAPHRRLSPLQWDVDVAFFSLYKTYGAHVGAMYISPRVKRENLKQLNHFFLRSQTAEEEGKGPMYPYQTSSVQYELNHSIAAVADYVVSLATKDDIGRAKEVDWNAVFDLPSAAPSLLPGGVKEKVKMSRSEIDNALDKAFARIATHESTLLSILIPSLLRFYDRGVRIVGPESTSSTHRAPTVAFAIVNPSTETHRVGTSKAVHKAMVEAGKMGAQQGHMYAHKLVSSLGLDLADGVVRLSFVHYNTEEEARRAAGLLEEVLESVL